MKIKLVRKKRMLENNFKKSFSNILSFILKLFLILSSFLYSNRDFKTSFIEILLTFPLLKAFEIS